MAALDPISATEYNNIRASIAQQVGRFTEWTEHGFTTSTTVSGYGRNFTSGLVTGGNTLGVSDTVTEQQMFDLFLDLQAAHVHIFNTINPAIATTDFEGKTSFPNIADVASRDIIEFQHITDLTTISTAIAGFNYATTDFNQNSFDTEILKLSDAITSTQQTRSTSWGGNGQSQIISHTITIDFGTHNNFLYYLFAGGEIRFDAGLTGGTTGTAGSKDADWADLLSSMGTIRINYRGGNWVTESYTGTGTGSSLASIATGTATTQIFEKQGGGEDVVYNDNFYRIYAATNNAFASATQLIFKIEFDDGDVGTGFQVEPGQQGTLIDESVTGTLTSTVYTHTPNSVVNIDGTDYNAIVRPLPFGVVNTTL